MNNFNIINTNLDLVSTDVKKVQLTEVRTNEYKKEVNFHVCIMNLHQNDNPPNRNTEYRL
jgi:hypothetical protein